MNRFTLWIGMACVMGFPVGASSAQGAPEPPSSAPVNPQAQAPVPASANAAAAPAPGAVPPNGSATAPAPSMPRQELGQVTQTEMLNVRDPFKRPDLIIEKAAIKTELEKYALEEFKMIGVLTGPDRMRALVKSPDGKTHFVAAGMKIGQKNGVVRKITSETIQVRERVVNVLDQEENVDSIIQLQEEPTTAEGGGSERARMSSYRGQGAETDDPEGGAPRMPNYPAGNMNPGNGSGNMMQGMPQQTGGMYNNPATQPEGGPPGMPREMTDGE